MSASTTILQPRSRIPLTSRVALFAALAVYFASSAAIVIAEVARSGHHLIYPLDDTYIEMAMCRSFAFHGVWGVTRYAFAPASSSPLYTLLLAAAFRCLGLHAWLPLVISFLFGALAICFAAHLVSPYLRPSAQTALLAALVLLAPLFAIGTLGMEHTLHLALALAFLNLLRRNATSIALASIAGLLVATRYEGLCLALCAAALYLFRSDKRRGAAILCGTLLPVCAYAVFSRLNGGHLVPNSIALKVHGPGALDPVGQVILNCVLGADVVLLACALWVGAAQLRRHPIFPLLLLIIIVDIGHLAAGRFGWGHRYEAYALGLSIVGAGLIAAQARKFPRGPRIAFAILAGLGCALSAINAASAAITYPKYSRAIYLQQWQMAEFLRDYFPNASVAANDIGAISFDTDIHCVDLVGLADMGVFRAKESQRFTTDYLAARAAAEHVEMAIVYEIWFPGHKEGFEDGPSLPRSWIRVATLTRPHEQEMGEDTVSLYATSGAEASAMRAALRNFSAQLPKEDTLRFSF